MTSKGIYALTLALVLAVVAGAAVAQVYGEKQTYPDIHASVVKDGGITTVVVESDKDIFSDPSTSEISIYVTDFDEFIHGDWFDIGAFYTYVADHGEYDSEYDVLIPTDAVKITGDDLAIAYCDAKTLKITFNDDVPEYCLFQIMVGSTAVTMKDGAFAEAYDAPTGEMITASIDISGDYWEYQSNPSITLSIYDGKYESNILPDHIVFSGGFEGLEVTSIDRPSDNKIVINTSGSILSCNSIAGIVTLSPDAYIGPEWCDEDVIAAYAAINYNCVILDTFEIDISDDYKDLIIPVYFSQSYYEKMTAGRLSVRAYEGMQQVDVTLKGVTEVEDETFAGYAGFLYVPVTVLDVEKFNHFYLCSNNEQIANLTTYSDSVMAVVYEVSEDCKDFKLSVIPMIYDFAVGVTKDNFTFPDGFTVKSFTIDDGVGYFEVTADQVPQVQDYAIGVAAGTFTDLFGHPSEEMYLCTIFVEEEMTAGTVLYGLGNDPSVDDMVKAIYSSTRFNDIYSLVELGIGVLGTILEATGTISIPDPEEMRFQALMLQCERIQIMLSDISAKLDKVSNQIMKLDYKLDQMQMKMLKNEYGKYVEALNNLQNISTMFSKHIKTKLYNEVINGTGNFYIYLIRNEYTDNTTDIFSIKHGSWSEQTTGGVIGVKNQDDVLQTLSLPIGAGTFKQASKLSKYVEGSYSTRGSTAYYMLEDLKAYFEANPIAGFTKENLAIGAYKAIIYKLVELDVTNQQGDSDKLINAYKQYASVTASLHNGRYDPNITNNYHSGIDYVEMKYNFYGETEQILKTINYSAAMNIFTYGAFVNVLDQLSVSTDDTLPMFMEASVKYLKENDGHRDSATYSYVAHGNLSVNKMTIKASAKFHSKDNFKAQVYDPITDLTYSHNLGQNKYVNTDMFNKMRMRWQTLGSPESSFPNYVTKCTGIKLGNYLMTKFDGAGDFSEGDAMYLQSSKNKIVKEHGDKWIVPTSTWFTLAGSWSAIKTYSESWSNIKVHFTYNGEVIKLSDMSTVKVGGKNNCIYAFAGLTDHRWYFVFDEATIFTSYGYYDDDFFTESWQPDGYELFGHQTELDYLCIS